MVLKFVREQSITCMKPCTECQESKARRAFDISPRTKKPYPRCRKCRCKTVSEWEERRAAVRSGHEWCTKCKQSKVEADFDESKPGRYFPWCRECRIRVLPRKCKVCGGDIVGRKHSRTCSDLCEQRARNDVRIKAAETRRKWLSSEKGKRYSRRQAELNVGRTKRLRVKAIEAGICPVCRKRKPRPERVTCEECGKKGIFYTLKGKRKKRKAALKCFGSQCCCCGETESKFLVITAEKKVICYNCRFAIVMSGVCPHQELENAKVSE